MIALAVPSCRRCCGVAPAGNLNLDGPIYIDLEKRTSKDGQPLWQIKDVYYGELPSCAGA